jgi:hypothetical protein
LAGQVAELYDPVLKSKEERKGLLGIFKDVLGVLAEGLKDHFGNKRYFARKIVGGGHFCTGANFDCTGQKE